MNLELKNIQKNIDMVLHNPYLNRVNGVFFGQIFTVYFNDRYIVILGTNVSNTPGLVSNEDKMRHIFYNILDQKKPYNTAGVKVE